MLFAVKYVPYSFYYSVPQFLSMPNISAIYPIEDTIDGGKCVLFVGNNMADERLSSEARGN